MLIRKLTITLIFFIAIFSSSCAYVAESRNILSDGSKRVALLEERLGVYTKSLYWGNFDSMGLFVVPSERVNYIAKLKKDLKDQKFVSIDTASTRFLNTDNTEAEVVIEIQYYQVPNFLVKTREEKQKWVFRRFDGGWFYSNLIEDEQSEG